jgi:ABC-2 type transport system ATP-binding protein
MRLIMNPTEPLAIEACDLNRSFGKKAALDGLNLAVPEGAFSLLVGDNGSGKSTLLRSALDLSRPQSGSLKVFGRCPATDGAAVRASIGYVPEQAVLPYVKMDVAEFLGFCADYYRTWDASYAARLVEEFAIDTGAECGTLSKGGARRVQIVTALAHRPSLLLLDEPADGLDPVARDRFLGLLAVHLADSPTTVLLASHLVQEMDLLCDHLAVIVAGRLMAQLSRADLDHKMKRYVIETDRVPDLERTAVELIDCNTAGRESACVIWGEEEEVLGAINAVGGKARIVQPLSLAEATRALLNRAGRSS